MKARHFSIFFSAFSLLLFSLLLTLAQAAQNTDFLANEEHQFWFDINDLPTVKLHFSELQWQELLTSTYEDRPEVSADFNFVKNEQTHTLTNIGVKVSGNTSFVLPEDGTGNYTQANFTLDFDEFVDDQLLSGVGKVKLKRFKDDSTFVHEPLTNQIMHNFDIWTVHSSTYVRVEVQVGERPTAYFGMYRLNESVERKQYIKKRFESDNDGGFLWQGNHKAWGAAHFSRITADWGGVGDFDQASFEYKGKGSKYEEGHAQLVEFAQNFTQLEGDDFKNYVAAHINMPLMLKGLAAEAVLGHWDGFWGNGNNYFIYIDEREVMHFVPYDTDNTLGTSLFVDDVGERNPLEFGLDEKAPLLVKKILAISDYREQFKGYLTELVTNSDLMVQDYALDWIAKAHQLIENDLVNDTGHNEVIVDEPAFWGNQSSYRIFELDTGKNWYSTRKDTVIESIAIDGRIYPQVYYRGVTNDWGTSPMAATGLNTWEITVDSFAANNADGEPRFKFDIYGDWQTNFGDNNADGVVEAGGADILFTEGDGRYHIAFDAETGQYQVTKVLLAPTADAGQDVSIDAGDSVTFDASLSSDFDGDIVEYAWSNGLSGVAPSHTFNDAGSYEITLTVTDDDGLTDTDIIVVTVNEVSEPTPTPPSNSGSSSGSIGYLLILLSCACFRRRIV